MITLFKDMFRHDLRHLQFIEMNAKNLKTHNCFGLHTRILVLHFSCVFTKEFTVKLSLVIKPDFQ